MVSKWLRGLFEEVRCMYIMEYLGKSFKGLVVVEMYLFLLRGRFLVVGLGVFKEFIYEKVFM